MELHDCSGLENTPGAEETVLPKECQQISSSDKNVTTCSPGGERCSQKNWVGVCGPLSKTPYPIY